ncbi:uncharacterized protein LOC124827145 [Vigna umbellata]|uniref:Uncharacterized protein n=2 Tax=Phaseolus angularis TaxID=3914 RepID=A0A0L9TIS2_PHAAN|nr:uncharacterized protein LOC108341568 [Vigna angularis]XP_047156096.1 uncharacterized protein LOC124827145 [Vigna umbellata]KOM30503.1 hypothetical protein LR48_Vigan01g005700 [Vigna angularis]BAT73180.1 hypothetical protein VIGAN_01064300 [Vigna angularis var. angularis]
MEGLLPLVFRAIKKRKTRSQYQCLSSGAALSHNMNVSDHYYMQEPSTSTQKVVHDHAENVGYRRYDSCREFSNEFSSQQRAFAAAVSPDSKQLVRFRSLRMFQCLAG